MSPRRVAVTGLGVISALGPDLRSFWAALATGVPGIRPIESIDPGRLRFRNGAEIPGYDPRNYFDEKQIDLLDRFAQFALIAARAALLDSGLSLSPVLCARTAVVTGSSIGGQATMDRGYLDLYQEQRTRVSPMSIPRIMANSGASQISMEFGITGPVYTLSTACSSANHAIGHAFWLVRQGLADAAIAGGSEAPFVYGLLKAWEAMRVVSPDTCRPFSRNRQGLVLGEGAAMLVLEPLDAARARGARIYAEAAGFGMSSDAHHLTQPSSNGAARAMQAALEDGGLRPEQIGYINAHGTGTPSNDPVETRAIRQLFRARADHLAVSSTKSMHGHALGAAGALEAAATVLALSRGLLPPTANYCEPDPDCDLDVVPNTARAAQVECALSNSFAFGGLNAVLAFRSWNSE
ncbi:MAG: beta-ketoacyl-[acyl-carrier-protein] synthase family protein [Bryobacteraceae bacterium]